MVTKWSSPDEFVAILSDLLGFQSNKTPSDKAMQASFTSQEEFCNQQNVNCTLHDGTDGTTAAQHEQAVPLKETCVTGIDLGKRIPRTQYRSRKTMMNTTLGHIYKFPKVRRL